MQTDGKTASRDILCSVTELDNSGSAVWKQTFGIRSSGRNNRVITITSVPEAESNEAA